MSKDRTLDRIADYVIIKMSKQVSKLVIIVTVQLPEEARRRGHLNVPYDIVGELPTAELLLIIQER